jgi:hypothetical protein
MHRLAAVFESLRLYYFDTHTRSAISSDFFREVWVCIGLILEPGFDLFSHNTEPLVIKVKIAYKVSHGGKRFPELFLVNFSVTVRVKLLDQGVCDLVTALLVLI